MRPCIARPKPQIEQKCCLANASSRGGKLEQETQICRGSDRRLRRSHLHQQHQSSRRPSGRQAGPARASRHCPALRRTRAEERHLHRGADAAASHEYLENTIEFDARRFCRRRRCRRARRSSHHRRRIRGVSRLDAGLPHRRPGRHARTLHGLFEEARHRLWLYRRWRQDLSLSRQGHRPDADTRRGAGRPSRKRGS